MGCCTPTKQPVKKQTPQTDPNPFASLKTGINIPLNHQLQTNHINNNSNQQNTGSQLKKTTVPSPSMKKMAEKDKREIVETKIQSGAAHSLNQNGQVNRRVPQKIEQDYPDMDNYGNAQTFYQLAAGRQADNVLRDEDFGYYAANGRDVSLKVDMNH